MSDTKKVCRNCQLHDLLAECYGWLMQLATEMDNFTEDEIEEISELIAQDIETYVEENNVFCSKK